MTHENLIIMDAPANCSGISIQGVSYPVEGGQALIPSHLAAQAFEHGFSVAKEAPQKKQPEPAKAIAEKAEEPKKDDDATAANQQQPEPAKAKKQ